VSESRKAVSDEQSLFVGVLKGKFKSGDFVLASQVRPSVYFTPTKNDEEGHVMIDEMYAEYNPSDTLFLMAGRRQIVYGVAYGHNPTDIFNEEKEQDRTLPDDERRAERKGDNLVGVTVFGVGHSAQMIVSPAIGNEGRDRWLAHYSRQIESINADATLIAYYGDRPGIGLNFSVTLSDSWLTYLEVMGRHGRDRMTVVQTGASAMSQFSFQEERHRNFNDGVYGTQYTSATGFNVNIEYWNNTNAYSEAEYEAIQRALSTTTGPPAYPQARSLLAIPNLRREKIFIRLSELKLDTHVSADLIGIFSLVDESGFLRAAMSYEISQRSSFRVGVDRFIGRLNSEYGMNQLEQLFFAGYRYQL
jgi:hypothetical protein